MTNDVSYSMVMDVTLSWDQVKAKENYQDVIGESILVQLFELEPKARTLFKFSASENVRDNPKFTQHAHTMVDMIDFAVGFLGPDLDPLADDLIDLGRRHVKYGVQKEFLPWMGKAVMNSLEILLGSSFTSTDRSSWDSIFAFMITKMELGMK